MLQLVAATKNYHKVSVVGEMELVVAAFVDKGMAEAATILPGGDEAMVTQRHEKAINDHILKETVVGAIL